jgi:PKD repeat protein
MRKRDSGRLIGLAILLVFTSVVLPTPHAEAASPLSLDGSGFGSSVGNNCDWSQKLTTANASDVIVAMLVINDTTTIVTSVTDTASLSWTPTPRASQKGPENVQIFYYYAIASTPLFDDSVTFALSSGAVSMVCQDFGISGADTNAPFDPNAAMPNVISGTSTTATLTYNTNNPSDFLIILEGYCAQGAAGSGSPAGFTTIVGSQFAHATPSNCAANSLQTNTYYKIASATQSSTSVTWTFDSQNSPFAIIGDAIESTPAPLNASVSAGSNVVDVGQPTSFSCVGSGGLPPYTLSWTFGDGSTGSGANTSHIYNTPGTMTVVCTVTDTLGTTTKDSIEMTVDIDPSITAFTASPTNLSVGEKVTFTVLTNGGYGALSYSYTDLPVGCRSTNATFLACTPTASGNYNVTVTVTDHAGQSTTAKVSITVGPQRVLGLPQAMGLVVIFGALVGISAIVIVSIGVALRRKRRRQAPATAKGLSIVFRHTLRPQHFPSRL